MTLAIDHHGGRIVEIFMLLVSKGDKGSSNKNMVMFDMQIMFMKMGWFVPGENGKLSFSSMEYVDKIKNTNESPSQQAKYVTKIGVSSCIYFSNKIVELINIPGGHSFMS